MPKTLKIHGLFAIAGVSLLSFAAAGCSKQEEEAAPPPPPAQAAGGANAQPGTPAPGSSNMTPQ
jgi:hypothetical protein